MENKKQPLKKVRYWLAGILAGLVGFSAAPDKAHAEEFNKEVPNNAKVTDMAHETSQNPVNLNNFSVKVDNLKNETQKTEQNINKVNQNINSVGNVFNSLGNLGRASNLQDALNRTEGLFNNIQTATDKTKDTAKMFEKTKKSEIKNEEKETKPEVTKQAEVEKASKKDMKMKANVKTANTKFNIEEIENMITEDYLKLVGNRPTSIENALSEEIVSLNQKISQANYNIRMNINKAENEKELAKLMASKDKLLSVRIKLTEARRNNEAVKADTEVQKVVKDYSAKAKYQPQTAESIKELTSFRTLSPNLEPGQKIAQLSTGLTDLKVAITKAQQNGDKAVTDLVKIYNEVLVQRYQIAKEAAEHPNDPKYDLRKPVSKDDKPKVEKTKMEETKKYPPHLANIKSQEIFDQILGKKTEPVNTITTEAKPTKVTKTEVKEEMKPEKASRKEIPASIKNINSSDLFANITRKDNTNYNMDELNNVSYGQAGILAEDEKPTVTKKSEINNTKKEEKTTVKPETTTKIETKSTNTKGLDKYKANLKNIDVNTLFGTVKTVNDSVSRDDEER